jgi:tRNA threonylcarbamoyl adenosine modification protein (Sua5/YciO/YrdC/YwlC family)
MLVVDACGAPPPEQAIVQAAAALCKGQVVAVPTDTVYGLAVSAFHAGAPELLFRVKGRPRGVDLAVLVAGTEQAMALCQRVPPYALRLVERFWPGPLTLVLDRRPGIDVNLGEHHATIGVRCPAHAVPLAICARVGPIATTSANRHGEPPLTTALDLAEHFGPGVALALDAGRCAGAPSSVVDCTGDAPRLLREGNISAADIDSAIA